MINYEEKKCQLQSCRLINTTKNINSDFRSKISHFFCDLGYYLDFTFLKGSWMLRWQSSLSSKLLSICRIYLLLPVCYNLSLVCTNTHHLSVQSIFCSITWNFIQYSVHNGTILHFPSHQWSIQNNSLSVRLSLIYSRR